MSFCFDKNFVITGCQREHVESKALEFSILYEHFFLNLIDNRISFYCNN